MATHKDDIYTLWYTYLEPCIGKATQQIANMLCSERVETTPTEYGSTKYFI